MGKCTGKQIVIWGTGRRAAMYGAWLKENFHIVAYVATWDAPQEIHGIGVVTPEHVREVSCDYIVLTVEADEVTREKERLCAADSELLERCVTIDEVVAWNMTSDYLAYTNERQLRVIRDLLSASDEQVSDYDWMYDKVVEYGIFCFNPIHWIEASESVNWAVYGLQQVPEEFAAFCAKISTLTVGAAAEVGVYRGRSAFFICAVLARKNPDLRYKMIDLFDRIDDFELFADVLPQLEKSIPSSSDDYTGQVFDFVFIDADHSYDASILDYNNIGQQAKVLTCFHDIYAHEYDHENGGTVRTWQEVMERTADREHWTFSKYPKRWMGIGCVVW